jgi:hypothetical protein
MPAKASVAQESTSATLLKKVPIKAPPGTQLSKGTNVPSKAVAPSGVAVSNTMVTVAVMVTVPRAGVLRISTDVKRPAVALPPGAKGK